ncbi:MaoC family dehydratase [Microbacterium sp. RU33B]|uniref:MaoC family dehydratase n=1 Tax=Microbacterium sp. RU33B TaxID=1907390 RepID=UPI00095ED85C|nr:MaoC family dehydratase [Microbacterium sp. RU33B]SIT86718.1 Acyl dehydratase [Microbacterium sp. RU33B]
MRPPRRTVIERPSDLLALVGQELGVSEPRTITQAEIDLFADVTYDHQWIHVDAERAKEGPFGTTVAHGFFSLALAPRMLTDTLEVESFSMGVNYGLDRVRFLRPVPPDTPIQAVTTLVSAAPITASSSLSGAGIQAKASMLVEFTHDEQPCYIAELLFRYYD